MRHQNPDLVWYQAERDFEGFRSSYDISSPDDETIHQLRVLTKKLRAYLRVYPDDVRDSVKCNRAALRELKDSFAGQRDFDVLVNTAKKLIKPLDESQKRKFAPLLKVLEKKKLVASGDPAYESPGASLEQCMEAWPDRPVSPLELLEGVDTIYTKVRRRAKKALKTGGDTRFHEWRKRVKEFVYCLPLFHDGDRTKPFYKQLKKLAKVLGNQHDLAVLRESVRVDPDLRSNSEIVDLLTELIEQKESGYIKKCIKLDKKLFAEKHLVDALA